MLAKEDVAVDQIQYVIHVTLGLGHLSRCSLGKRTQAFFRFGFFLCFLLCFSSSFLGSLLGSKRICMSPFFPQGTISSSTLHCLSSFPSSGDFCYSRIWGVKSLQQFADSQINCTVQAQAHIPLLGAQPKTQSQEKSLGFSLLVHYFFERQQAQIP